MGRSIRAAAAAVWLALLLSAQALGAEARALVPLGRTVGLELETDGVYVVGFDGENGVAPAEAAGLRVGDRILAVNGAALSEAETLRASVEAAGDEPLVLSLEREGKALQIVVQPRREAGVPRLGVRVRDRIAGLGTLTFYDPETGLFGALGHGVSGGGTGPMVIRGGEAAETAVTGVKRGQAGSPGSLLGPATGGAPVGSLERNTERGLFGHGTEALAGQAVPLAERGEVCVGPAELWCSVEGSEPVAYAVQIEAVRCDAEQCRDLRILVTDPRLLARTGGIVQGMSGSPILQNGKFVGAVTHVLVRDPTRGYGILIGHMLQAAAEAEEQPAA